VLSEFFEAPEKFSAAVLPAEQAADILVAIAQFLPEDLLYALGPLKFNACLNTLQHPFPSIPQYAIPPIVSVLKSGTNYSVGAWLMMQGPDCEKSICVDTEGRQYPAREAKGLEKIMRWLEDNISPLKKEVDALKEQLEKKEDFEKIDIFLTLAEKYQCVAKLLKDQALNSEIKNPQQSTVDPLSAGFYYEAFLYLKKALAICERFSTDPTRKVMSKKLEILTNTLDILLSKIVHPFARLVNICPIRWRVLSDRSKLSNEYGVQANFATVWLANNKVTPPYNRQLSKDSGTGEEVADLAPESPYQEQSGVRHRKLVPKDCRDDDGLGQSSLNEASPETVKKSM